MRGEGEALLGGRGPPGLARSASDRTLWIPITIHLPFGLAKSWTPTCAEFSVYGPLLAIIFFAQLANTVLVPVLPFMVTHVGADPIYYGLLQSAYWVVELVSAPILGGWSDRVGRRVVIAGSLLVSASAHAVLALAPGVRTMLLARVLCGCGFQLALCRAYFAEVGAKQHRASSFGLIGVITGVALTMGPTLGGLVGGSGKPHNSAWFACVLCLVAAAFAMRWRPLEPVEKRVSRSERQRRWVRIDLEHSGAHGAAGEAQRAGGDGERKPPRKAKGRGGAATIDEEADADARRWSAPPPQQQQQQQPHGSDWLEADGTAGGPPAGGGGAHERGAEAEAGARAQPWCSPPGALRNSRLLCKLCRLNAWLARQGVYPLLLLNTAFRLAFSVYKSSFAFFCMHSFGYGAAEVGLALSLMGLLGIFVQGVLLRLVVAAARDGSALCLGLLATSLGLALLSAAHSAPLLVLSLGLITVGYGLCVPSLSALFSHVPMQQGVMQGIAGSADRLGQAIGPVAGMQLLGCLGERGLMRWTGVGLFLVCSLCVQFIRDADGDAISTALARLLWRRLRAPRRGVDVGGSGGSLGSSSETETLLRSEAGSSSASEDDALQPAGEGGAAGSAPGCAWRGGCGAGPPPPDGGCWCGSCSQARLPARAPQREESPPPIARERSVPSEVDAGLGSPYGARGARAERMPPSPCDTDSDAQLAEEFRALRERSHTF